MKKIEFFICLFLLTELMSVCMSYAQTNIVIKDIGGVSLKQESGSNFHKLDLTNKILNSGKSPAINTDKFKSIKTGDDKSKEKSPYLAGLLSAVVTGAGEFYAKSYIKGAIFIAVEAGLWVAYASFQNKGDSKTNDYQNYADKSWDVRKYAQWLVQENFPGSNVIVPNTPDKEVLRMQINQCEEINFSHTLPVYGEQQYYEVIGKYQNFVSGWSDASGVTKANYGSYKLPQVDYYMTQRQDANNFYYWGSRSLEVVILNHVLSAADAVWTVSVFNKNLNVKTGMSFQNVYAKVNNKYNLTPFANLSVTF